MIRKKLFTLILTFIVLTAGIGFSDSQPVTVSKVAQCSVNNWTFKDGEQLIYKVYFNWGMIWLNAGEIVMDISERADGYYISASGRTYKSYEWLYKVRDRYETLIDKETLLPKWLVRNIHENDYRHYEKMVFDQSNNRVTSIEGESPTKTTTKTFSIKDCGHNLLSVIYFFRNQKFDNFSKGKAFPASVVLDRQQHNLKATYMGNKKNYNIKGMGRYNVHQFSPETISGEMFSPGTRINLYVSDDNNQIPISIETSLRIGSIKVQLASHKNLRYNFTSKVK